MVQAEVAERASPVGGAERGALAVLALLLVAHVGLYAGLFGGFAYDLDTQHYARIAWELASGELVAGSHPFSQRFAVTAPTALAYSLLGVSAITTTLWPLIVSLVAVAVVYLAARRASGPWTGVLAAFLLAANIVQSRHTSRLLPDIVVATFMLIAVALVQAARESDSAPRQRWLGAVACLSLVAGVLAKESAVWAGGFFLVLMVADLSRRRNAAMWGAFAITGVACGAAFFAAYAVITGDALYRLAGIEGTHNTRDHSFFGKPRALLVRRLAFGPVRVMLRNPGYGLLLLLALPSAAHLVRPIPSLPRATRYWAGTSVTFLLFFWFGSTSLMSYNPLPIVLRFMMPFLAPLAILSAITLRHVVFAGAEAEGRRRSLVLLAAGFLAGAAFTAGAQPRVAALYGACGLAALVLAAWPAALASHRAISAGWVAVCGVYLLPTVAYVGGSERMPPIVRLERVLLDEQVETRREPTLILTDPHSVFFLPMVLEAETLEHVRVRDWSTAAQYRGESGRVLVYVHEPRLMALDLNWDKPTPAFALAPPSSWQPIAGRSLDQEHWIRLFQVDDLETLTGR